MMFSLIRQGPDTRFIDWSYDINALKISAFVAGASLAHEEVG